MAFISSFKLSLRRFALYSLCIYFTSCQDNSIKQIKSYYFPLEKLEQSGKIYHYAPQKEQSLAPYFMFYEVEKNDTGIFLHSEQFDANFIMKQNTTEEVVSNGMLMTSSNIYLVDSSGNTIKRPVEIQEGAVFPFEVKDSTTMFFYKIKWQEIGAENHFNIVTRNRIYAGDTTYNFQGEEVPCVKFNVRELVENVREGNIEHEFNGIEIYGKGIGLLYYRKNISSDFVLEYELKNILDEQSLNLEAKDLIE